MAQKQGYRLYSPVFQRHYTIPQRGKMKHSKILLSLFIVLILFISPITPNTIAKADDGTITEVFSPYYTEIRTTDANGRTLVKSIINGPRKPLPEYEDERLASIKSIDEAQGLIPNFPSYSWVFGCSAVSQAMITAYHDRTGAPNLYTGPTDGGFAPITDTQWPRWTDGAGDDYPSNPIIASRIGIDGRTIKGSIEDYWVKADSTDPDPYITGGWTEHTFDQAVGDYMFTSQSKYDNVDGSTVFWTYNDNRKLTCDELQQENLADGTLGRRNYYQARGYQVSDCYNQVVDSQVAGGFSLAQFKAEIDAGQPVLLNLKGHSVVGYGYEGNTIYIRDTWSSDPSFTPTFQWGGSYEGMELRSVSIVKIVKGSTPPTAKNMAFPMILKAAPPPPPQPIKNWDFEQGAVGWSEYSSNGYTIIDTALPGNLTPTSGVYAAWLGGAENEIAQISQSFYIPPSYQDLAFNFYFASADECGNDYFYIKINGGQVGYADLCTSNNSSRWATARYPLTAYQGQTIQLTLEVTTDGSLNSNVLIDDVRMLLTGAPMNSEGEGFFDPLVPGDIFEVKSLPN